MKRLGLVAGMLGGLSVAGLAFAMVHGEPWSVVRWWAMAGISGVVLAMWCASEWLFGDWRKEPRS